MLRSKFALVGLAALAITGCATTHDLNPPAPPIITNQPAPITFPTVSPMNLQQVHWTVRDIDGLKLLIQQAEASGQKDAVFYVLTRDQYEVLAMNLSEVKRYVADQRVASEFLKAAIEINNKSLADTPPPAQPVTPPAKKKLHLF